MSQCWLCRVYINDSDVPQRVLSRLESNLHKKKLALGHWHDLDLDSESTNQFNRRLGVYYGIAQFSSPCFSYTSSFKGIYQSIPPNESCGLPAMSGILTRWSEDCLWHSSFGSGYHRHL